MIADEDQAFVAFLSEQLKLHLPPLAVAFVPFSAPPAWSPYTFSPEAIC
jgi:hypothetical protein